MSFADILSQPNGWEVSKNGFATPPGRWTVCRNGFGALSGSRIVKEKQKARLYSTWDANLCEKGVLLYYKTY